MVIVVTYDIDTTSPEGRRRLHEVAKLCESIGTRVQKSVFEMLIDPRGLDLLKNRLTHIIDASTDSVRFYRLGSNWEGRVSVIGVSAPCTFADDYIV